MDLAEFLLYKSQVTRRLCKLTPPCLPPPPPPAPPPPAGNFAVDIDFL